MGLVDIIVFNDRQKSEEPVLAAFDRASPQLRPTRVKAMTDHLLAKVFRDRVKLGDRRGEKTDEDGGCAVEVFRGRGTSYHWPWERGDD
jgi:hypothetical protein